MNPSVLPASVDQRSQAEYSGIVWRGHVAVNGQFTSGAEPGAILTVKTTDLWLTGKQDLHLARTAIQRITYGSLYPWFFYSISIHHNLSDCPRDIQFKPLSISRKEALRWFRDLGYPVDERLLK